MSRRGARKVPPARCVGVDQQPVSCVEWVPRDQLRANLYNPNSVPRREFLLLKFSLLVDGWTAPLLCTEDGEIVNGYHRWLLSEDPEVAAMTGGLVPVVRLRGVSRTHQIMSTVRQNRASGAHGVVKMAVLTRELLEQEGVKPEEMMLLLQMEREEVERLSDRGGVVSRAGRDSFNNGWIPE